VLSTYPFVIYSMFCIVENFGAVSFFGVQTLNILILKVMRAFERALSKTCMKPHETLKIHFSQNFPLCKNLLYIGPNVTCPTQHMCHTYGMHATGSYVVGLPYKKPVVGLCKRTKIQGT